MRRLPLLTCVFLLAATVAAATGGMGLGPNGTLYILRHDGDQMVLTERTADGVSQSLPVPETWGVMATNIAIAVDPVSEAAVGIWQEEFADGLARVMLVGYAKGTWTGPFVLAGDDGVRAANPSLLVHRAVISLEDGDEIATSIVFVAWWRGESEIDGNATLANMPLNDSGQPLFDERETVDLFSNLPYGFACSLEGNEHSLAHPKLFIDPQSGNPHVVFPDLEECLFNILELEPVLDTQRGRLVVILATGSHILINPNLTMNKASFAIGHNLSVVIYWDVEDAIKYVGLNEQGWSELKVLQLTDELDHERAVNLIRSVAH